MKECISYHSPIGLLEVVCENQFVTKISIVEASEMQSNNGSAFSKQVVSELNNYFSGKIRAFSLPVKFDGTAFQQRVWSELQKIPYGETISYQELAKRSGNAKAYRAAGTANGKNPICIVVPCHRVVHADGGIGGYAYGVEVKQRLLDLEKTGRI